jgi:hypothetical protein
MKLDQRIDISWLLAIVLGAIRVNCRIDVQKCRTQRSCSHFANGGAPFRTGIEFAWIKTLQDREHAPVHFAVDFAHRKKRRNALPTKIVINNAADTINPFGLGMRRQQSERFMTVRVNPSAKGV